MAAADRAQAAALRARADTVEKQAAELERLADTAETVLHTREQSSSINVVTNTEHRLAIARARPERDDFDKAINSKGYTRNSLASAVGVSPAAISRYRRKKKPRGVPKFVSDKVKALTGYSGPWPGGVVSDD
jgi:hypothetical protein